MAKIVNKSKKKQKITERDKLFLMELLADPKMNPANAARKVGYADSVAKSKAYLWVSNSKQNPKPHIKELYDKILRERTQKLEVSVQKIENELIKIGFSNLPEIMNVLGDELDFSKLKNLNDYEKAAILEISHISQEGFEQKKLKLHSKIRALELLGKRYKMFIDESEPIKYLVEIIFKRSQTKK